MAIVEDVLNTALVLPVKERAILAERLLQSLEEIDEREIDQLWGEEAERRLIAYRQGMAQAQPAAGVHARAEQLLHG